MRVHLFVCGLCLCVLSGCGGSSSSSSSTGNLRFVQASPDAPQSNLNVDGKLVSTGLGYGNASGYISLNAGTRHVQVIPQSGASPILDLKVSIVSSGNQTLIETGKVANVQSLLLTDTSSSTTTTTTTEGSVRVVNAALNIASADVYLVAAGSSIAGISPVATSLGINSDTGYELVPIGAYEVFMTAPGTKNVFLDTGAINMTSNVHQTVIVLDGVSGGFTFTALTDQ